MEALTEIPNDVLNANEIIDTDNRPRLLLADIKDLGPDDAQDLYYRYISGAIQRSPSEIINKKQRSDCLDNVAVFCRMILGLNEQDRQLNPKIKDIFAKSYCWLDEAVKPLKRHALQNFKGNNYYDNIDAYQVLHESTIKSIIPCFDPEKASFYTYFSWRCYEDAKRYVNQNSSALRVPVHTQEQEARDKKNCFRAMGVVSLQENIRSNGGGFGADESNTYEDIVADEYSMGVESEVEILDEFEKLCEIANKLLTPKQKRRNRLSRVRKRTLARSRVNLTELKRITGRSKPSSKKTKLPSKGLRIHSISSLRS